MRDNLHDTFKAHDCILLNCLAVLSFIGKFSTLKGIRTVLMEDCPSKWTDKSFKENNIFFCGQGSWFSPRNIPKKVLTIWTSTD